MFVIQHKPRHWVNKWETFMTRYKTLEEAKAALAKIPLNSDCRIAEEYTVTRYKAVKLHNAV